ncbi:hypothetical protein SASPL_112852 [Salvia splendens]|uniref:Nucleosome assembly protein 1-like 1 n=1 Tax=Salvia splendens TaxID=180675 RepID=A0A8X8YEM9_SALSN|nr:hypothetical protein SASPL_112852 [Salvia splendens]
MKNNEVLAEEISERDEGALKFLKDIKWFRIENPKGFKLEFYFDTANPYFKNAVLTKTYHMIDEDEPILEKAIGTEIEWLPGKCLTQKILKKKPKKGSKNTKPITKTEQCESFFNFFSPPQAEELQSLMEQDYDIGSTIRDKIIPHAVSWFTGEAAQDEKVEGHRLLRHILVPAVFRFFASELGFWSAAMGSNNKDSFNVADLGSALNAEDRAGLVNALKDKLQDLTGKHSDVLENLSPDVRKRVDTLRDIQAQHDELESKFFEERAVLEAKYQKLYQPLYTKRFEIVNGDVEVEGGETEKSDQEEKGVPDFWLTAMKNNEVLAEEISERDEGALKFLKDIKWFRIENPKGFKLEFYFDTANPYFKNAVLTKTYHMIDEDEPILEKAIGTEIEWLPGKCLTQKILKKKPKKGSKNTKPITKTEQCESFFNFFSPPQAEELQNLMEHDYDIGAPAGEGPQGERPPECKPQ